MSRPLAEWIKAQARALGFEAAGVAPLEAPPHAPAVAAWLERGYQGGMGYLARTAEGRLDPARARPWARSAVAVALLYDTPPPAPPRPAAGRGWVSRYAWGADYRPLVIGRLERLLERIRGEVGAVRGEACCDAQPVLERALAARAGLGWQGKNTTLLHPRLGSFCFLGELFLDLELPPDSPVEDGCGSCRLCLDACPTGALPRPYLLDARRCIAYLTVELKGPIPPELRPGMGDHLFGCDLCQEVCPYNARRRRSREEGFWPRAGAWAPGLLPLLALSESAFRERFQGSPILRAGRRGLLRSACVALGNGGQADAVPVLARILREEPEGLIRRHAAWALGRIGGAEATRALQAALGGERDPGVREELRLALGERPAPAWS